MSWLETVRGWLETRASKVGSSGLANPEPWVVDWLDTGPTSSGASVTEETSLKITAVWACVRLIAGAVASLPLRVLRRREDGGKDRATNHWLYSLLHDEPNPEMTSYQWREASMIGDLLWGNAYTFIELDGAGRITALWPITADRVTVTRDEATKRLIYTVTATGGPDVEVPAWQILHVPGMGYDGIIGQSPIALCREAVGLSVATEEFGSRYFGQGLHPGLALEHPLKLSPEAMQNIKRSWRELHQGLKRSHDIAVLQEGMKVNRYGIPPEDAQFLQTRQFQLGEIARIFGVPPHMIGDVERSTSWGAGIEAQGIGFVTYVLRPWLVRWEQAINARLFSDRDRQAGYFAEFSVDGLLRGDFQTRTTGYQSGITGGWLTRNEVRALESLNPLEGLDAPLQPLNAAPIGSEQEPEEPQDATVASGADVQSEALNGAQVESLVQIVQAVSTKQLPASTAKALIMAAFPLVSESEVDQMLEGLENFEPAVIDSKSQAEPIVKVANDDRERFRGLLAATWLRILKRYRNDYAGAAKANRLTALVLEVRKYGIEQFEPIAAAMKRDDAAAMFDRGWPGPPDSVPLPDSWGVSTSVEALAWKCGMASAGV